MTDVDVVWLTSGGEWISGFKLMLGGIRSFVCFFNEKSTWVTKMKDGICLKVED